MPRLATLIAPLLVAACATMSPPVANVELENAADGTRTVIRRGADVKVLLDANITTGYQWNSPTDPAPVLSVLGSPAYVAKGDPRLIGGGGFNTFGFRADKPGTVTLVFEFRRPWETGVPPARVLRYEMVVE